MGIRRDLSKAYKQTRLHGGVYIVINTVTGRYLIGYALNLASIRNRFDFARSTGAAFDYKLREDWLRFGADAFRFDVLEELEQRPDQNEVQFRADLQALEELRRAGLDPNNAY